LHKHPGPDRQGRILGVVEKGKVDGIDFIHGRLRIGEAMSPPLIRKVRSFAGQGKGNGDREKDGKIEIIDAPPGTSCPVIAAMNGVDFVLMVTEPTPFGLHDLKLAVEAVKLLDIPAGLVINRCDIGDDKVKRYAEKENLPVLMEIPFDRKIARIYSKGEIIVEKLPEWKDRFRDLYRRIEKIRPKKSDRKNRIDEMTSHKEMNI